MDIAQRHRGRNGPVAILGFSFGPVSQCVSFCLILKGKHVNLYPAHGKPVLRRCIELFYHSDLGCFCGSDSILNIRNGIVKHASVADVEINLSATMIELAQIL